MMERGATLRLVIDTHIALELLLFADPRAARVDALLARGAVWLATPPMRDEFERVLRQPMLQRWTPDAARLCAAFDECSERVDVAARCALACRDPDDQMFIDLALAQRAACLLTRDRALLALRAPASRHGLAIGAPEALLQGAT